MEDAGEPPAAATPPRAERESLDSGGAAPGALLTPLDAASSEHQLGSPGAPRQAGPTLPPPPAAPPAPPFAAPQQQPTDSSSIAESSACSLDREYASGSPERASSPDVLDSARSDASVGTGPKLKRMQQRTAQLRKLFSLPASEGLLNDYACALKKRMLLQGRMYVFSAHLCFYSSLFGYVKVKVIPLRDVLAVHKKKNVGFPNSIELVWLPQGAPAKREFFTSFLARAEAYQLIMAQWRQHSALAPSAEEEARGSGEGVRPSPRVAGRSQSMVRLLRGVSSLVHRDSLLHLEPRSMSAQEGSMNAAASKERRLAALGVPPGALESLEEEVQLPEETIAELAANGAVAASSGAGGAASAAARPPPLDLDLAGSGSSAFADAAQEAAEGQGRGGGWHGTAGDLNSPVKPAPGAQDSFVFEFEALSDQQCRQELESELLRNAAPAPPVDLSSQHLLDAELPCHPLEFWCRFLANQSDFPVRFHTSRGDSSIKVSKWQRHFKVGMVRDLQFVTPVKAKIGPPQAMCHQTQRLQVCAGCHLLLETSQVMSDIPYSDHFSVETRWDVVPSPAGCRVTIHLRVPFSKSTLWRKFIEKGTFDTSLESMQAWVHLAAESLAEQPPKLPLGLVPTTDEEWRDLISKLDMRSASTPQPGHTRRHSRAASLGVAAAGVPVGRHAVLARHRRTSSRVLLDGAVPRSPGGPRSPSMSTQGSRRVDSFVELTNLATITEQAPPLAPPLPPPAAAPKPARAVPAWLALALLVPLLEVWWLAGGPGAAALAVGCALVALQAALLVQQHQHLSQVRSAAAAPLPYAVTTFSARGGSSGADTAALQQEVWRLQLTLQQLLTAGDGWRAQLDAALSRGAELAAQLQQAQQESTSREHHE